MQEKTAIYWIRNDLRLADNPALAAAIATGKPVIPLFVWSPDQETPWTEGAASRAWLERSLEKLAKSYDDLGSRLLLRTGDAGEILTKLCQAGGASAVFASYRYEPASREEEGNIRKALAGVGADLHLYPSGALNPPEAIETTNNDPYQVFTPYYKRCLKEPPPASPLDAPESIPAPDSWPDSQKISDLELTPSHSWVEKVLSHWEVGEEGAHGALEAFLSDGASRYKKERDLPGEDATSVLSSRLHFGELSPRQVWHAVQHQASADTRNEDAYEGFIRQLYWREFAHHLLYHFPHTPEEPLKAQFAKFPWNEDNDALRRWQRGQTGYPIVDAGMRELWETGWMHNRVRMIVASFLVKDLRIHWRAGADWFWETLVDADLANNTLGWQWVAGCGADAAPYFRIFNPITQGKKFDPHGAYVRHWVPELAELPDTYLHCPWEMGPIELAAIGLTLGRDYPEPMVDHGAARKKALALYDELKSMAG